MIPTIVAAISFVTILVTTSVMVAKATDMKKQYDDKLRLMTDQINNAQYYNSKIDDQNISDIKDVRKTYASKNEIARNVDTNTLSARAASATDLQAGSVTGEVITSLKSTSKNMRADKLTSTDGMISHLDAANIQSGRINMLSGSKGKGAINFGSIDDKSEYLLYREDKNLKMSIPEGSAFMVDGERPISLHGKGAIGIGSPDYMLQRVDKNVSMSMPKDSAFLFGNEQDAPISIKPSTNSVDFGNKWTVGKTTNAEADQQGIKYDALGMNFDNNEVVGMYNVGGQNFTRITGTANVHSKDDTWMLLSSDKGDPIFMGTNESGKGIASWGDKPFEIWSMGGFKTGGIEANWDKTSINGVSFSDNVDSQANIINDQTKEKRMMMYGNTSADGKTRKIGLADAVDVYGDMASAGWTSGKNVQGRDYVVAGDWKAYMRNDGVVQGKTVNSAGWASGQNVQGRDYVTAGDWKAYMRNDGSIQGKTLNSDGWTSGQNVQGRDYVTAGDWKAHMRSDGQIYGKNIITTDAANIGQVAIDGKASSINAKTLTVNQINPQSGLKIANGPLSLAADVQFGIDNTLGANKRFVVTPGGMVGIGTEKPRSALEVNGNIYTTGITKPPNDPDMLRVNYDNANNAKNSGVGLFNGVSVAGGGGLYVGGFDKKVPDGTVQATGKIITPSITRQAGDKDWFRINYDNSNYPVGLYGPVAIGQGLAVGSWDDKVPAGTVQAAGKVVTPSITRNPADKGWFRINYDNSNYPVGLYGPVAIGQGLAVGSWDDKVPAGTVQASGKVITPSITRKAGDKDWLRINFDNPSQPIGMYGNVVVGQGSLEVGSWTGTVPTGTIQTSGNVIASGITRKTGANDWFRINYDNSAIGTAIIGPASVGKGLSVGTYKTTVPVGNIEAANQLCINATCINENDLKNVKAKLAIV